jgi:phosphatidylethanolamine/phosphatidyl-N-methylethanolamine N-methyltransferase
MASKKMFIKQFWKEKRMVGAISASSRTLGEKMIESIDFNNDKVLVELGPGTGVFTEIFIEKMPEDAVLFVFELNDRFYEQLKNKITDKRIHIIHDTAEKVEEYLQKFGHQKADAILSSLPLAMFSKELRESVLMASKNALKPGGTYVQFQYSLQAKKELEKTFKKVKIGWTPRNFPPAFVYTCKND